jgi:hypothetical protein
MTTLFGLDETDRYDLFRLAMSGATASQVAAELDRSVTSVGKVARRLALRLSVRESPSAVAARVARLAALGVTPEQYDEMLSAQGGTCAICEQVDHLGRRLAVDHDHETGEVRGLLCGRCNTMLGQMNDDPELLRRAASYLERQQGACAAL